MDIYTELPLSKAYPDTIECQYVDRGFKKAQKRRKDDYDGFSYFFYCR
ncbi:MAG: hypothetical protein WBB37_10895 [bacterium]